MFGIAVTTVQKYRREGKLIGKQIGHKYYFQEDEIYSFLATPDVVTPPSVLEAVRKQPQPAFIKVGNLHLPADVVHNPKAEKELKRKQAEHKRKQKELQKAERELARETKRAEAAKKVIERSQQQQPRKRGIGRNLSKGV
jgi:hypothetical protein